MKQEDLNKKRDELADKYILAQNWDEDCLTERTQPGTPVGEHIDQYACGCFIHETFQAGFNAAVEWMYENEVVPRDELIVKMKEFCEDGLNWNMSRVSLFQNEMKKAIEQFEKGRQGL